MREKYNSIFPNSVNTEISYIQKYLGSELETVLNPDGENIHDIDFDSIYVDMPSYQDKLSYYKKHLESDKCLFLTGLTGCGKSSLLNHVFHIYRNSIIIDKKSLYITFSFDCSMIAHDKPNIERFFINQIKFFSIIDS